MDVAKYCEDGLLFDVAYTMTNQQYGRSHFIFPIDETEESVKKILMAPPYNIKVIDVIEANYVLKLKN